jgi:hypothetical protein
MDPHVNLKCTYASFIKAAHLDVDTSGVGKVCLNIYFNENCMTFKYSEM